MSEPYSLDIKWVGEHKFDAGRPGKPTMRIDGDGRTAPSSVDALIASLATCSAYDVIDILAKRRTPVESLEIEVVTERVDTIPRHLKHVTLNYRMAGAGIEREHAERAIELAVTKYCSVGSSIRPDVPVDWTVEINNRGPRNAE
ncbi:MAG: OsmC family protein [Gemmatimonadaceae bacterium]